MQRVICLLLLSLIVCLGCEWQLKTGDKGSSGQEAVVERYDRVESQYLTTGDFAALQHMNTNYPQQTRTLIEDILQIGRVNDPEINSKFLHFYQDTTLQNLLADVGREYANMDDVNRQLETAFCRLETMIDGFVRPEVYAQVSSLDQSVVVGNGLLGISLDKYMGSDYPLYVKYGYSRDQRRSMTRSYIVPDCIGFYLLSLFPMPIDRELSQEERDQYIGKIQWVVNKALDNNFFKSANVRRVGDFMHRHKDITIGQLLRNQDIITSVE